MTDLSDINSQIENLKNNIGKVIYIDDTKLEYLLAAFVAGGHVMLADSHGVGKTSLCRALAGSIEWEDRQEENVAEEPFSRIQCTVDLLPQDIVGFSRLTHGDSFVFNRGPIFANFVLCDEINLLTPKTQGSFFQAMEEGQVSFEGKTYNLPDPFFIISTMNLKGSHLFPLPAPQLDRFMIQLSMGYPSEQDEMSIVLKHGKDDSWKGFGPVITSQQLIEWQKMVDNVEIHQDVVFYLVNCLRKTRSYPGVLTGASPRTGIKLSRMARALSLIRGKDYVTIDDIKEIMIPTVAHRLILEDPENTAEKVLTEIMAKTPVEKSKAGFAKWMDNGTE